MTRRQQLQWYSQFDAFRKRQVNKFAPKVYKVLIKIIRAATNESTVQQAITQLDRNLRMEEFPALLNEMYVDAGRIMGARVYQMVKQQAEKMISRNEEKLALIIDGEDYFSRQIPAEISKMSPIHSLHEEKRLVPIGFNEELINSIIEFMKVHNLKMVLEISQNMKEWILSQLIEGQQKGWSIDMIKDEIIKHDFPRNRAIVISRTETMKGANYGQYAAATKSGYAMQKTWISTRDFRTRRTPKDQYNHLAMNGITIDVNEFFKVPNRNGGYDNMLFPLDPNGNPANTVQCRCTAAYTIKRNAQGLPVRL